MTSRLTRFAVAGAPVYHERLCLGEMLPGHEVVIMTPDNDVYPESIISSADVWESLEIRGLGAPSAGVAEGTIYRFYALPPDGELVQAIISAALDHGRPVPPMPYFLDISPTNVFGLAPGLRDITGPVLPAAASGSGGVRAAPSAAVPGGVAPPGPPGGALLLLPAAGAPPGAGSLGDAGPPARPPPGPPFGRAPPIPAPGASSWAIGVPRGLPWCNAEVFEYASDDKYEAGVPPGDRSIRAHDERARFAAERAYDRALAMKEFRKRQEEWRPRSLSQSGPEDLGGGDPQLQKESAVVRKRRTAREERVLARPVKGGKGGGGDAQA